MRAKINSWIQVWNWENDGAVGKTRGRPGLKWKLMNFIFSKTHMANTHFLSLLPSYTHTHTYTYTSQHWSFPPPATPPVSLPPPTCFILSFPTSHLLSTLCSISAAATQLNLFWQMLHGTLCRQIQWNIFSPCFHGPFVGFGTWLSSKPSIFLYSFLTFLFFFLIFKID